MLEHIVIALSGDCTGAACTPPPASTSAVARSHPIGHSVGRPGVLRPGHLGRAWQGSSFYFSRPEYYGARDLWARDSFLNVNIRPAIIPSVISLDTPVLCPDNDEAVMVDGNIVCEEPAYVLRTRPAFYSGPGWLRGHFSGRRH